jgi:hypothetical protein
VLDEDLWAQSPVDQRDFLLLGLLMLLQPHHLYGLHANGIVKEDMGVLLVGDSGAGKTTLALSLIHAGWHYLADDALVLHRQPSGIEALALRRSFSCTAETAARFPVLGTAALSTGLPAGPKRVVDLSDLFRGRFCPRCVPRVLLFPLIVEERHSRLAPMEETASLLALVRQSAGILTSPERAHGQLAVLAQLVQQARSYRFLMGSDIWQGPALAAPLLQEIM